MSAPIDVVMDAVAWHETGNIDGGDGMPYATHHGVLRLGTAELRCYRLNTGQAIIHADDMNALFGEALADIDAARGAESP